MCSFSSLLWYYQSFMRNQEGKIELQKKLHRRICVRDITFLTAHPPFYATFCCFLRLFPRPLLPKWRICRMALIKLHNIAIVGFVCDDIMNEQSKMLMQFHTSWLASLRTRYYFRLCFSFICSGYDFTLIKKSQTLNCYSFLQKFLLK